MEGFINFVIHILVPFMLVVFLTIVTILILNRSIHEYYKFKIKVTKAKIDVFLTTVIFSDIDEAALSFQIEQFKHRIPFEKNWCKEILLDELINVMQNLKGDSTRHIHFMYEQFGLFEYSVSLFKSPDWYVKSIPIYHFQALQYPKGESYIIPYITHTNKTLSTNAYIALISLTMDKLDFLIDYPYHISMTSQIKVMDILHSRRPNPPANLGQWILSSNRSIVRLGIKFMVFYNDNNHTGNLIKLLDSPEKKIRHEIIIAARHLFIDDAEHLLINLFEKENKKNQIEILTTLALVGGQPSQKFMADQLDTIEDVDVKLAAVCSLNTLNSNYFHQHFQENQEVMQMLKHFNDPYILA